jgi:hypothetical protein
VGRTTTNTPKVDSTATMPMTNNHNMTPTIIIVNVIKNVAEIGIVTMTILQVIATVIVIVIVIKANPVNILTIQDSTLDLDPVVVTMILTDKNLNNPTKIINHFRI